MPTFEKRSGKLRVSVMIDGVRHRKSFDNKADAQLWAKTVETDIAETAADTKHTPATFCDVLAQYETLVTSSRERPQNEILMIKRLKSEKWVNMRLSELTVGHLSAYKRVRLLTIKASSLHRYFDIIRSAAQLAQDEWDWNVDAEMFRKVKIRIPPASDVRRVTDDEIDQLLRASREYTRNTWLVPLIEFALLTGVRRQELVDLRWGDVDVERNIIHVRMTKTDYPRRIPLTTSIKAVLDKVVGRQHVLKGMPDDAPVFNTTTEAIRCSFTRLKKRSGVKFRFHDLRHEAISRLFEMGLNPVEVASISGHRTMKTLMRYSHADTQNLLTKMEGALT